VKIKLLDEELYSGRAQAYYEEAGAIDLRAREDHFLFAEKPTKIPLGVAIELEPGQLGILSDRSSTFLRGLIVHQGFIDADYRGELSALVIWNGTAGGDRRVQRGDRLAQLAVVNIQSPKSWLVVNELSETERGSRGFGSSGAR
jgi:dUTP pyrophosphatase